MRNQVQLITYAERLGANLGDTIETVRDGLCRRVRRRSRAAVFRRLTTAPTRASTRRTTRRVDPRLGSWNDMRDLAATHDVVVDVIVNHVSSKSRGVSRLREQRRRSEFADMFLTFDTVFPRRCDVARPDRHLPAPPGLPFTPDDHRRRASAGVDHLHVRPGRHRRRGPNRAGATLAASSTNSPRRE